MHRFTAVTLLSVLAAACAARPEPGPGPVLPTTVLAGGTVRVDESPSHADVMIAAPAAELWIALQSAYASLEIPATDVDPDHWILGNRDVRIRRTLAGARASVFFDCGETMSGRPAADSYTINASITTQVIPHDSATTLVTRISATGRSPATSSDPVRCSSTGSLEERIRKATILALGAPGGG